MAVWEFVNELVPNPGLYLQLFRFLLVFVVGVVVTRAVVMPVLAVVLRRRGASDRSRHSIVNIAGVAGFFLSFTIALSAGNFGNLVTVLGTVAAALTVAIGFGMRDQVSNLLAGLFIFLDSPFVKGDYVKTEATEGVVEEITIRATTLRGTDSETVVVPNSQLTMEELKNYTANDHTKSAIRVSVPNNTIAESMAVLSELAAAREDVLSHPEPSVFYTESEREIVAELHYWVASPEAVKETKSQLLAEFNRVATERGLFGPTDEAE